jgi:hypothetical protein
MKPILVDVGPATTETEARWIRALRTKCRLLNDHGGDVCWAAKQLPTRLEAKAYAGLLEMLGGEKATVLRRPKTSWLAMRKAREQGCGRWAFAF